MVQTEKEKVLLTLILLVPFCLLVTGNPLIQIGLVCYAGLLLYLVIDRKFLINLKLPPIMDEGEVDAKKELTGLSNVRESEQRVIGGIRSTINNVQPPKTKTKNKPGRKRK